MIESDDPVLKNEFVVVGAHFDHLGMGGKSSGSRFQDTVAIHNGADDNASGTAGVIQLAEKFVSIRKHLKRSIIFIAFTGEELGLLGSKEFISKPPVNLKNVVAMINLDMIGRLKSDTHVLSIGGTGTWAEADSVLKMIENGRSFNTAHSPEGYGPSDHASFYSENIPVAFFTTGAHDDYHSPADDIEKIDCESEVNILKMVYDLILNIAQMPVRPAFREAGPKQEAPRGNLKVTLGILPDVVSNDNNGLRVDGVRKGGPAEKAGILKGDRIVAIQGQSVTNIYDYMARLSQLSSGQVVAVEIIRNNKKEVLLVQF
jgi:hypothetical protein